MNTAIQKAEACKQHSIRDSLQTKSQKEKNLSTCEDPVRGFKLETVEKDSVIERKQELIACKDSTINFDKTQKKKTDFWNQVRIKVAGAIILIETIGLFLK